MAENFKSKSPYYDTRSLVERATQKRVWYFGALGLSIFSALSWAVRPGTTGQNLLWDFVLGFIVIAPIYFIMVWIRDVLQFATTEQKAVETTVQHFVDEKYSQETIKRIYDIAGEGGTIIQIRTLLPALLITGLLASDVVWKSVPEGLVVGGWSTSRFSSTHYECSYQSWASKR